MSFKLENPNYTRDDSSDDTGNNDGHMFVKSRLRHNHHETFTSILIDSGAKFNLISLTSLAQLGKHIPPLKPSGVNLAGADGSHLDTLGVTSLYAKLGAKEYLLDFHIINNLATTAIIGRQTLTKLKATLSFTNGTISFGSEAPIKLQDAKTTTPVFTCTNSIVLPGQYKVVPCKPRRRLHIHGSHLLVSDNNLQNASVSSVVDVKSKNIFDALIYNDSNTPLHVAKGVHIASLTPIVPTTTLYLIDESDLADIASETNTVFSIQQSTGKGKKRVPKPTFSRALPDLTDVSDEDIINSQVRYNGKILTEFEKRTLLKIVFRCRKAFSLRGELGKSSKLIYHIKLKPDADNFFRQAYKSSEHERILMRQEIAKLMKLGIIEESPKSYVPFCSPALLVAKSDKSARLVCDFRLLNSCVKIDHHVFQRIDEILSKIGRIQPQFFGSFDMCDSFFQIPLSEESKGLTTFTTEAHKLYQYCRLPQGLHNSPSALRLFGVIRRWHRYFRNI